MIGRLPPPLILLPLLGLCLACSPFGSGEERTAVPPPSVSRELGDAIAPPSIQRVGDLFDMEEPVLTELYLSDREVLNDIGASDRPGVIGARFFRIAEGPAEALVHVLLYEHRDRAAAQLSWERLPPPVAHRQWAVYGQEDTPPDRLNIESGVVGGSSISIKWTSSCLNGRGRLCAQYYYWALACNLTVEVEVVVPMSDAISSSDPVLNELGEEIAAGSAESLGC